MKVRISMIICSFFGNPDVLGDTLYPRLCVELEKLMETDDCMELLLVPAKSSFFNVCLKATLEIKSRYPDRITVTCVVKRNDCQSDDKLDELPPCMVDHIRVANVPVMKGRCAFLWEEFNLQRCAIKLSTHVICCLYEKLFERENSLLAYAKKHSNIKIVDVSDGEIVRAIAQHIPSLLKEREQFVVEKLEAGFVYREIGEMMGVSSNRAQQILIKGGARLRRLSYETFGRKFVSGKQAERPVCVLFSLNDPSPQKMETLETVLDVLIDRYRIGSWKMSIECCASPFVEKFATLAWRRHPDFSRSWGEYHPRLSAVISDKWCAEENDMNGNNFCLPIKRMEHIDTTSAPSGTSEYKMMVAMAEQADFFICDLSTSPIAEEVKSYFAHTKGVSLLDIGKTYV